MRTLLTSRGFLIPAAFVVLLLTSLTACAWYHWVWSLRDLRLYRAMRHECHPVWRDLHHGRIHAGQDVEEVIAATDPVRVERYGSYVRLSYQEGFSFSGVTIMAKGGRVAGAGAWSCTWHRVFFNELTEEDDRAFRAACEAHRESIRK